MKTPCTTRSLFASAMASVLFMALALLLSAAPPAPDSPPASKADKKVYVCPPCGGDCDNLTFDHPGVCPECGMTLVEKTSGQPVTVAILLFNGVQIIDYSGPWEVFGHANYKVFTVAEDPGAVTTVFGQTVVPSYTFQTAPKADILVIPGGNVGEALLGDRALIGWVRAEGAAADHILSVCTGAFIAASAGYLDGKTATTYHGALADLARVAPTTKVVWDRRYVDNGKVIVTAGLSSGIDGALHLVSKIGGLGTAQGVALAMEYNWEPDSRYARAALADRNLTFPLDSYSLTYLSREGDRDRWENRWLVKDAGSLEILAGKIDQTLAQGGRWHHNPDGSWNFRDEAGSPWTGHSRLEAVAGQSGQFHWTLEIARG
jgi:putative intracellular protease/amidase